MKWSTFSVNENNRRLRGRGSLVIKTMITRGSPSRSLDDTFEICPESWPTFPKISALHRLYRNDFCMILRVLSSWRISKFFVWYEQTFQGNSTFTEGQMHIWMSSFLARKTQKICSFFHSVLQVARGLLKWIFHIREKEWLVKPNKSLKLIKRIANKLRQFMIPLLDIDGAVAC